GSPFNIAKDDLSLGNLKFVPKSEEDEVFGMKIPKELITDNIRNAPYYKAYLEMVAKHDHKIAAEEGGKKKSASKVDQSKKPATAKQPKPVSFKQSKPAPAKQPKPLVDEEEQVHPEPEPQVEDEEYDLQRATKEASTGPSTQPEDDSSSNIVCDTPSPTDAETCADTDKTNSEGDIEILNIGEEQGEDLSNKVDLEEKTAEIDEGQAGSDPGKTPESRPLLERVLMEEDQAGPNPG
ncbi:hypothetical protein Tco_0616179, partial [Tanacetum coccineum]